MKPKKFLLVLVPVFAFILVACGDFFDDEVIDEELDQGTMEDEFMIEMDESPEVIYEEEETWDEMEDEDAVMEEEFPVEPEMME